MRRIAVINQKGGVGKTTTCANLGAALALQGRRVVLVDMDAQANLSLSLDVNAESETPTSYSVLLGQTGFGEALRPTKLPGLSLVAANIDLSGAEMELAASSCCAMRCRPGPTRSGRARGAHRPTTCSSTARRVWVCSRSTRSRQRAKC
jgi:cellulose biosynthesis protein BcsQ